MCILYACVCVYVLYVCVCVCVGVVGVYDCQTTCGCVLWVYVCVYVSLSERWCIRTGIILYTPAYSTDIWMLSVGVGLLLCGPECSRI